MFFLRVLRNALFVLVPISFILTFYLYLYPIFDTSCAFPAPEQDAKTAHDNTWWQHQPASDLPPAQVAPFRLLTLADPQLEGDSSIPDSQAVSLPNLAKFWKDALQLGDTRHSPLQRLRHSLHDLIDFYLDDIPKAFHVYRKRLDHVGNDYYLGHIYRTLHWWARPTHVTVLGDLLGSQWIDNQEFEQRGWRYWNRVFKGGLKVEDEIAVAPTPDFNKTLVIGEDASKWKRRIINVAGNHDVGYSGDLSASRIERFVKVFGQPNYELRFQLPKNTTEGESQSNNDRPVPELRIIVLNDMNMDAPAGSSELQAETYSFMNEVISTSQDVERAAHFTLVLTHIPLYKEADVCVDSPFFDYYSGEFSDGVKEQNHLSESASEGFLQGIFGMSGNPNVQGQGYGRNGLILNGHDHEGCDTYHFINQTLEEGESELPGWQAKSWSDAVASNTTDQIGVPGLREITVRSMMGDFAGNAGLLSLWFDEESWEWKFEFANCQLGKQHLWWIVHILDLITLGVSTVYVLWSLTIKFYPVVVRRISARFHAKTEGVKLPRSPPVSEGTEDHSGPASNGLLSLPDSGKKGLRKRRSRQKLKAAESSPNSGSTTPVKISI